MLGTEVDLQQVENSVFSVETVLKAWLHEQGGDREHLQLLLPSPGPGTALSSKLILNPIDKTSVSLWCNYLKCFEWLTRRACSHLAHILDSLGVNTQVKYGCRWHVTLTYRVFLMAFVSCVVCVKCDMQECLISPALIPLNHNLGMKTETVRDFLPVTKGSANQSQPPQRLKAIK